MPPACSRRGAFRSHSCGFAETRAAVFVAGQQSLLRRQIRPATFPPVRNEKEQSRILIVDDRPENLLALKSLLAELDHAVVEAGSGRDALKILLQDTVDLILLDVNMPVMDGFETARLIRQRSPASSLPILFVSAREPNAADLQQGYSLGAVDYITKPVVPEV